MSAIIRRVKNSDPLVVGATLSDIFYYYVFKKIRHLGLTNDNIITINN